MIKRFAHIFLVIAILAPFAVGQTANWPASGGGGSGDVTGPAASNDNRVARFNGTTGKTIQESTVTLDDSGNFTGITSLNTTVSSTELGYLDGVTSALQTQLDAKEATVDLTASRAVVSDALGGLAASTATSTEVGYLSGVTSSIQTQLAAKSTDLTTHANDTTTHGTIGNVVGTTDMQTLTTKTIDGNDNTLTVLAGSQLSGATPIANGGTGQTTATAAFDALSPTTTKGDVVISNGTNNVRLPVSTDGFVLTADAAQSTGVKWAAAASSADTTEINYILSPDNAVDWTDAAGGITITTTTTSSEFPRIGVDTQAIKLVNENTGTDGVSYCLQVGEADKGKKLKIEWAQRVDGTFYESGDFEYKLVSDTSATCAGTETGVTLHSSGDANPVAIPAQSGVVYDEFDADDSDYYELYILRDTAAGTDSGWITLSSVVIGPGKLHSGAVVTPWEAFTAVWEGDTGSTQSGNTGFKRRVGDSLHIRAYTRFTAISGTGNLGFNILDNAGVNLNTSAMPTVTRNNATMGTVSWFDASATNTFVPVSLSYAATNLFEWLPGTGSVPLAWSALAANDQIGIDALVPIEEWKNSGVLNVITQDNLSEWTDFTPSISNFSGTLHRAQKRRNGDTLEIMLRYTAATSSSTIGLTLPDSHVISGSGLSNFGTAHIDDTLGAFNAYGSGGGTTINFYGAGANIGSATYPLSSDVFSVNLRVPITEFAGSQSSLVGFSEVSQDQSGLVQSAGQLKGTNTSDDAAAGYVGEYLESKVARSGQVALTSATDTNVTSISLTAGDWDVSASVGFDGNGTTVYLIGGISGSSAIMPVIDESADTRNQSAGINLTSADHTVALPTVRLALAVTTTYYLVAAASFSSGAVGAYGTIKARRVR